MTFGGFLPVRSGLVHSWHKQAFALKIHSLQSMSNMAIFNGYLFVKALNGKNTPRAVGDPFGKAFRTLVTEGVSGCMRPIDRHAFSKQRLNVLSQRQSHIVLGCLKTGRMNGEA